MIAAGLLLAALAWPAVQRQAHTFELADVPYGLPEFYLHVPKFTGPGVLVAAEIRIELELQTDAKLENLDANPSLTAAFCVSWDFFGRGLVEPGPADLGQPGDSWRSVRARFELEPAGAGQAAQQSFPVFWVRHPQHGPHILGPYDGAQDWAGSSGSRVRDRRPSASSSWTTTEPAVLADLAGPWGLNRIWITCEGAQFDTAHFWGWPAYSARNDSTARATFTVVYHFL